MRRIARGVVAAVLVIGFAAAMDAAPREREPRGVAGKIVKKIKALGDLLTVPGAGPKP